MLYVEVLQTVASGPNSAATYFCKCYFIGMQPHPYVCILFMTLFVLQQQSWIVATETIWHSISAKLKLFAISSFTENVCCPLFCIISQRYLWDLALSYRSSKQFTNPLVLACFPSLTSYTSALVVGRMDLQIRPHSNPWNLWICILHGGR